MVQSCLNRLSGPRLKSRSRRSIFRAAIILEGSSMAANYISAISGLLPAPLRKLSLAADQQAGWRLVATLEDGADAALTFAGGTSPRVWLARHLASEYGMSPIDSAEGARVLFLGHLPDEVGTSDSPEPYGMHSSGPTSTPFGR